eukprot:1921572-Amphidinium_carterae.2
MGVMVSSQSTKAVCVSLKAYSCLLSIFSSIAVADVLGAGAQDCRQRLAGMAMRARPRESIELGSAVGYCHSNFQMVS